jgi:hypothetical protein
MFFLWVTKKNLNLHPNIEYRRNYGKNLWQKEPARFQSDKEPGDNRAGERKETASGS